MPVSLNGTSVPVGTESNAGRQEIENEPVPRCENGSWVFRRLARLYVPGTVCFGWDVSGSSADSERRAATAGASSGSQEV
jgi:hypothetical protein